MSAAADVVKVRELLEITQEQLADLLGVHPMTVSRWERGKLAPSERNRQIMRTMGFAPRPIREKVRGALEAGRPLDALGIGLNW